MVKYSGRFVVKDIANNRKYLADLLFGWDVGDNLTGWVLAGAAPTIAPNGKIDLFNNVGGAGSSTGYLELLNTLGQGARVAKCKFTRQADDSSIDTFAFCFQLSSNLGITGGVEIKFNAGVPIRELRWTNNNYNFVLLNAPGINPVAGVEYEVSLIMTQDKIKYLLDGVLLGEIELSNKGNSPLSNTQIKDYLSSNKRIHLGVYHGAGTVSHYQVRDIKVGRLVGVSW